MKKYVKIVDGFVQCIVNSPIKQNNLIELDFDIPESPGPGYMFDINKKTWVDVLDKNKRLFLNKKPHLDKRLNLLNESDWTDTISAKSRLGDDLFNKWQEYRQALRDITLQEGFPENIIWPTKPE